MTQPQPSQKTIRPALTEKGGLAATIIALTVLGLLQVAAAEAQSIPTPPGIRKELIYDPVLTMDAYMVFIPAKWNMVGTIVQGTTCNTSPFPVFRASSPDALSELERLPRFDWMWGNNPTMATGYFTVSELEPGHYELTATNAGFETYKETNIVLATGGEVRVPVTMAAGSVNETLSVTAEAVTLNTENGAITGQVEKQS